VVVSGLNVELTSVYWVPCSSACRRPVLLRPLTNVDRSFVASSMPFDGTGRHVIRHVLVVAARNRTSVRLELPQSAVHFETGGRIPVPSLSVNGRIPFWCVWKCLSRLTTLKLAEEYISTSGAEKYLGAFGTAAVGSLL